MEEDLIFPEEIYKKYLQIISGIKFTRREIDIIACILSGKAPQAIANFLSNINGLIALTTVNTHMLSIRYKIGAPSKSHIIDFIENSDKHKIVQQYYLSLLLQKAFNESLNKITHIIEDEIESFTLISYLQKVNKLKKHNNDNDLLIQRLQNTLKFLNSNVIVDYRQHYSPLPQVQLFTTKKHYTIYIVDKSQLNKEQNRKEDSLNLKYENTNLEQRLTNISLLFYSKEGNSTSSFLNSVDTSTKKNYYLLFFDVIKKLFSNHRNEIDRLIVQFIERANDVTPYALPSTSLIEKGNGATPYVLPNPTHYFNDKYTDNKSGIWIKFKSLLHRYIYIILSIIILYSYFYKNTQHYTSTLPWNTPYLPEDFVSRSELRNKIVYKLQDNGSKLNQAILVGLHGLGGIGKTYLALDMIYNPVKDYSFRGWITSNDEDKLKADYFKLGNEFGLLRDDMNEEQKIASVKKWLNKQENLLLVFDNASSTEIIEKYLPLKGDIIITSRNYKIPSAIEVDGMEEIEALKLLRNQIHDHKCNDQCIILVKKLGYVPLAISQAGAYISQNNMTVDQFLDAYIEEQDMLLSSDVMPASGKHMPVYITWNLILKEIKERDKTGKAIELLNLISFCHFVDIPKQFLIEYLYGKLDKKTEIDFDKVTTFLKQYSLIKTTHKTVALHHLLQDCIRSNIEPQNQEIVIKKAIDIIKRIYLLENKKADDYKLVEALLPQMENLLTYSQKQIKQPGDVQLTIYIADAYCKLGYYSKARELLEKALLFQKKYYGTRKHIEIALILSHLGQTYLWSDYYSKARELLEEALAIQEKYYSDRNCVEIALTLSRLGQTYLCLGNYGKAKTLLEEALLFQEKYYGTRKHIEFALTLSHLGNANLYLGNYSRAKALLKEALLFQEKYYGTRKHIEIMATVRRLAQVYSALGDYARSKELFEEVLVFQEEYYGDRNREQVAVTISRLGRVYTCLGEYNKATVLLEEALAIQKKLNIKNNEIALTLCRLGRAHLWMGDYNEAKTLIAEAFVIQEKYYGKRDHVEIAFTLRRLGRVYLFLGDYNKAKEVLEEALTIQENFYGTRKHIEIAQILCRLGAVYSYLGSNKAKEVLEEALDIQEKYYGTRKHIKIAVTVGALGQIYLNLENYRRAKELLEEALSIQESYYGTRKHTEIAFTLSRLGQTYFLLGENNKAKTLLEEALAIQENDYGPNNPEVANSLVSLAQLEHKNKNDKHALILVNQAYNILQNYLGLNQEHHYIKRAYALKQEILKNI